MTTQQHWETERYRQHAAFVAEGGLPVLALLAPRPGERILDLGCGEGALTEKLVALGCQVIGVDSSPEQVAAARARGLDARVMEGQQLSFTTEFDAVFSNAALHWMKPADAVIAGVWRALKPGGRFVAECGGEGNIQAIETALSMALERRGIPAAPLNPWYFPAPADYRRRLEAHGFVVRWIERISRPTPLPGDIIGWLETFAGAFTTVLSEGDRPAFLEEIREALRPVLCDPAGRWLADYVRLRLMVLKPTMESDSRPVPAVGREF